MTAPRTRDNLGSFADIAAAAQRATGLTDFGADFDATGFEILCQDFAENAGLTPLGNYLQRAQIKSALVGRLLSEHGFKENPSYQEVSIQRPIFVTGLPRTGTTALHRLLHVDPNHQGLELWLTEVPQPRPPRETWATNPIFTGLSAAYAAHHAENPDFSGIHFSDAAEVEECWRILRQVGKSISFESLAYLPEYSQWLAGQNWLDAYQFYRRDLQLIGLNDPEKRWVLKNPSHLVALESLLQVFPDAIIIQTHRDPVTSVASACSLSAAATAGWSTKFVGPVIGETQLDMLSRSWKRFNQVRATANPAQFFDVEFADLNADPVGVVQQIYTQFELGWSDELQAAVAAAASAAKAGNRQPSHHYDLADYGLTEAQIQACF